MHQGGADRGLHGDAIAADISIAALLAQRKCAAASRAMVVSMLRFALIVLTCLLGVVLLSPRTAKDASRPAVEAANGIVVSTHRLASEAGIAMLQQGGNAIDAAVAIGYAEAVVDPCCGNIGGGGFLVAHLRDGGDVFLNFRETGRPPPPAICIWMNRATRCMALACMAGVQLRCPAR